MDKNARKQLVLPKEATDALDEIAAERGLDNVSVLYREAIAEFLARHGYTVDMDVKVGNPLLRTGKRKLSKHEHKLARDKPARA